MFRDRKDSYLADEYVPSDPSTESKKKAPKSQALENTKNYNCFSPEDLKKLFDQSQNKQPDDEVIWLSRIKVKPTRRGYKDLGLEARPAPPAVRAMRLRNNQIVELFVGSAEKWKIYTLKPTENMTVEPDEFPLLEWVTRDFRFKEGISITQKLMEYKKELKNLLFPWRILGSRQELDCSILDYPQDSSGEPPRKRPCYRPSSNSSAAAATVTTAPTATTTSVPQTTTLTPLQRLQELQAELARELQIHREQDEQLRLKMLELQRLQEQRLSDQPPHSPYDPRLFRNASHSLNSDSPFQPPLGKR